MKVTLYSPEAILAILLVLLVTLYGSIFLQFTIPIYTIWIIERRNKYEDNESTIRHNQ
jgi:hypothetical protein